MEKKLSIIIPVYNEAENVKTLYAKIMENIKGYDYEIIFIDDGSKDYTFNELKYLNSKDKNVKVIQFEKNFGKAAALSTGFKEATGDIIFTMDGDLQDDPKEIPKFIAKLNEGYDLVSGWKFRRKDPLSKTIPSKFFNWLTAKTTGVKIHDSNCGFKAYKKEVAKSINIYGELHRYIPALAHWKGFKVGEVKVEHHPRLYGRSKYGFERLLRGFLDLMTIKALMSYSKTLHLFWYLGIFLILAGLALSSYLLYLKFSFGSILGREPLAMLTVLTFILGVQFFFVAILAAMTTFAREKIGKATTSIIGSYAKSPLHFFGPIGMALIVMGFVTGAYLVGLKLAYGSILGRNPLAMMAALAIILGVQFFSFGILAEMMAYSRERASSESYSIKNFLK